MSAFRIVIILRILSLHSFRLSPNFARGGKHLQVANTSIFTNATSSIGGCQDWGTVCPEGSIYGSQIQGRNRLARECNLDRHCNGVVFIATQQPHAIDGIGLGYGYKCKTARFANAQDKPDHQFCAKDHDVGHVSTWTTQDQLTTYVMKTMDLATTAEKSYEFLKIISECKDTKAFLSQFSGVMDDVKAAMEITEHLKTVLLGVQGLSTVMAFAGLITGQEPFFVQVLTKLEAIKGAIADLKRDIHERLSDIGEISASDTNMKAISNAAVLRVQAIEAYRVGKELMKGIDLPTRMLELWKEIIQLQFAVMGVGSTFKPYFQEHLKYFKEGIYSRENALKPGYRPERLVERLMEMSARFSDFIGVQSDGIRVLGELMEGLSEHEKGPELTKTFTTHIIDLLENVAIQQKRNDPIRNPVARGALGFIFTQARLLGSAPHGQLGLCDLRAELQLRQTQKQIATRQTINAFWDEVADFKSSMIFSEQEVDSMLEMCGAAYRILNHCIPGRKRAYDCFPQHAKVLTQQVAFASYPFSYVGMGGVEPSKVVSISQGLGKQSCYEAVMEDPACSKDYFSYSTYGSQTCSCKTSGKLSVQIDKGGHRSDYYAIEAKGKEPDENTVADARPPLMTLERFELFYERAMAAVRAANALKEEAEAKQADLPMSGIGWGGMVGFGKKGGHHKVEAEEIRKVTIDKMNKELMALI